MPIARLLTATAATTVATAAVALSGAAPAAAETEHVRDLNVPAGAKVVHRPAKRLSLKAAARARRQARRTDRFPKPPALRVNRRRLERLAPGSAGTIAPAPHSEPEHSGDTRMFGNEAGYAVKRDPILGAIQRFNAVNIPRHGGRYIAPRLYEVGHGGSIPGCNGHVYNGVYCGDSHAIGWSMAWTADAFRSSGDMKWATLLAHEYGHAAQGMLGIRGGWMNYTLYSEGFADCMAGAFLWHAHYYRMTDSVGRGDHNEFRDAFASLASPTTQLNNHGTYQWRYALATYGWNQGFDGCTRWARSIDGV